MHFTSVHTWSKIRVKVERWRYASTKFPSKQKNTQHCTYTDEKESRERERERKWTLYLLHLLFILCTIVVLFGVDTVHHVENERCNSRLLCYFRYFFSSSGCIRPFMWCRLKVSHIIIARKYQKKTTSINVAVK